MKKYFILSFLLMSVTITFAQTKKIDFRTVDIKYLNQQQKMDFQRWRDEQFRMMKSSGLQSEVKSLVIQGNKIRSIIYNTGAISNPGVQGNVLDLVWNGLGYGYEFGPLIGSMVPVVSSNPFDSAKIVIDGFGGSSKSTADGDFAPDGITKWGWLPSYGYSASGQNDIASWGARTSDLRIRPKSWPENWYNSILGEYIYPSFLGGNSSVPDEEVYYVVDDSTDAEFQYFPMVAIPEHRGLGTDLEVRTMQFSNPLAEDIIFLVYTAENDVRSKPLSKVFFGMFGDPHIGGNNDYSDDAAEFIGARAIGIPAFDNRLIADGKLTTPLSRNIVYSWDPDGKSQISTIAPGYFGYKFLESPNNSTDGIDNDDDGLVDESPTNGKGTYIDGINFPLTSGIKDTVKYKALFGTPKPRWSGDENGDWNKETDDVGIDGIFGTGDVGEGNGEPDQSFGADGKWLGSEPNFGLRDVNESDQIGLRSFWSLEFGGNNRPKNDNLMYDKISSQFDTSALGNLYTTNQLVGDFIFLYGSGPFDMPPGHRERFSIALLMGTDLKDLLLNSETAQLVMQANYRFAQPPPKPKVTAVAGDGKVTLYWGTNSENTSDPFTGKKDFEGYKIYRSRDYTFKDVFSITDGNGYPFLGKALYDDKARKSAQWHRPWTQAEQDKYVGGFMPTEYRGRFIKYYMGEPSDVSGLSHEYVDSTVTNGITYYYAVVAFDHGDDSLQLPPSESQSIIQRDAVTQEFKFDVNTMAVVPNALGKGIVSSLVDIQNGATLTRRKGTGTGKISFKVLDEPQLRNSEYRIKFDTITDNSVRKFTYSIKKNTLTFEKFIGNENLFVNLQNRNIVSSSVRVFNGSDSNSTQIPNVSIFVDSVGGRIRATTTGILSKTKTYSVVYQYYPIAFSTLFNTEDANPVFDGIRAFVTTDPLALDAANSFFLPNKPVGLAVQLAAPTVGTIKYAPLDIRIDFTISLADTNASGNYVSPPDSFGTTNPAVKTVKVPFRVLNATDTIPLQVLIKDGGTPPAKLGRWDIGEEIIILTPLPYRTASSNTMMGITFKKQNSNSTPAILSGTSYTAVMKKPFTNNDEYLLTTKELTYDPNKADTQLDKIIVVPNPYVISSQFEIPSNRPDLRADRAIQFRNLPKECTIRIYTIVGELVQTLHKNDNSNFINWDLLSSESARIGYGLYIYHIETRTGGTKIGRIGIIK